MIILNKVIGNVSVRDLTINANLYVRLPFIGLLKVAEIKGPLSSHKDQSVKFDIIDPLGTGSGVVWYVKDSQITVYLDLDITLKWYDEITITGLELVSLPF
ncbi:hypothetical protein H0H93_016021 [Arthromyces matolae]|nr:hypothetical protein H0H93_016021 [Arthromyces matolae]